MKDPNKQPDLEALGEKLKQAQGKPDAPRGLKPKDQGGPQGWALAFRCGTDLVAGLVVGLGIGYALDTYVFDTKPWLMVVFFFLGAAAGIMNVFRTVQGLGMAIGYQETPVSRTKQDETSDT